MEAPTLERKLVAILAADAVGYSRLMERDEAAALATLTARRTVIDGLIASHRGRIAGTAGDSVLAEFASVFDAVQCAVRIQEDLEAADAPLPDDERMPFRIGINVGDVMVKDGDIFGDGVNIAARLQTIAHPGGICVARGVRDHIRHKLPFGFEDLGEQSVKNIAQPVRVFRLRPEGPPPAEPEPAPAVDEDAPATPAVAAVDPEAVELSFWESIKDFGQGLRLRGVSGAVSRRHLRGAGALAARGPTRRERAEGRRPCRRADVLGLGKGQRQSGDDRRLSEEVSRRGLRAACPN